MRQLGPYQLLRKIGSGGMAEVWSARRPAAMSGTNKFVAIKLLAPHLADKRDYRDMFLAEARLSMLLNHSNIVQVFDAVDDPPDCYMVMELIEGMTLAQLERALGKQGETIPVEVSAYIIGELLRALSYAHSVTLEAGATVVHRDVSPQNVMVTTSGEVKLMDFGIARFATEETQGSFVKGKLQYMPPEQLRKETRKPTIDLFAVGGILHELLDGRRFRGRIEETRLLGMVLDGEIPPLREGVVVPSGLEQLRLGLLEANEDERIQSAKDALQLLYGWHGFRNASIDLEELVQRFVAPASSMSAPVPYFDPEDSGVVRIPTNVDSGLLSINKSGSGLNPLPPPEQGEPFGPDGPTEPSSNSDLRKIDARAAADTLSAGADQTDSGLELLSPVGATTVDVAAPPSPPTWKKWALFAGPPLLFTVLGMVLMLVLGDRIFGQTEAAKPEPTVASTALDETEPPGEQPEPEGKTSRDDGTNPAADPTPAIEPGPSEPPKTDPDGPQASDGSGPKPAVGSEKPTPGVTTVPVEFVANEFFFLYVKVAGKTLTLEPRARTKLPVGSHTVYLRSDKNERWTKVGKIDIDAKAGYRIEMKKPASLVQVEVDQ